MLKNVAVSIVLNTASGKPLYRKKMASKYEVHVVVEGQLDDGLGTLQPYRKNVVFLVEPTVKRFR